MKSYDTTWRIFRLYFYLKLCIPGIWASGGIHGRISARVSFAVQTERTISPIYAVYSMGGTLMTITICKHESQQYKHKLNSGLDENWIELVGSGFARLWKRLTCACKHSTEEAPGRTKFGYIDFRSVF